MFSSLVQKSGRSALFYWRGGRFSAGAQGRQANDPRRLYAPRANKGLARVSCDSRQSTGRASTGVGQIQSLLVAALGTAQRRVSGLKVTNAWATPIRPQMFSATTLRQSLAGLVDGPTRALRVVSEE